MPKHMTNLGLVLCVAPILSVTTLQPTCDAVRSLYVDGACCDGAVTVGNVTCDDSSREASRTGLHVLALPDHIERKMKGTIVAVRATYDGHDTMRLTLVNDTITFSTDDGHNCKRTKIRKGRDTIMVGGPWSATDELWWETRGGNASGTDPHALYPPCHAGSSTLNVTSFQQLMAHGHVFLEERSAGIDGGLGRLPEVVKVVCRRSPRSYSTRRASWPSSE